MMTLQATQIFTAQGTFPHPRVAVHPNGTVASVTFDDSLPDAQTPGALGDDESVLTPAFLDIHTHGGAGEDVMSATPGGFAKLQAFYASRGVAWYCPTTVTADLDTTLRAVERMATEIERGPQPLQAQPLGIHLEGPFLAHAKRGVHPSAHLLPPDVRTFERLYEAAGGHVALLTVAPELDGALDLISRAVAQGVRVSLGHTNATAAETLAALDAGATSATHTFNAMRALDHREPGVLGITLDDERMFAEIIADGVHVAPALVRLWYRAKGSHRAILVTDSMSAAGAPDGSYTLGGLPVTVARGRALLTDGLAEGTKTLAGSVLTLDAAVANMASYTGCPLAEAVRCASHTPAALLGRPELTSLVPGQPANLNRLDEHGRLLATYLRGEKVPEYVSF